MISATTISPLNKRIVDASFVGLLDNYGGAAAAYSIRRLSSTYSGSLIQVRRSSDNTLQDIGFDSNGDLDTASLLSFVGASDGFVRTWYDQSGNSNNAQQTTTSSQPQVVSSGSILTLNSKPAVNFNGTTSSLLSVSASNMDNVTESYIFSVLNIDTYGANEYAFGVRYGSNGNMVGVSINSTIRYWNNPSGFTTVDFTSVGITTQILLSGNYNGTSLVGRYNTTSGTKTASITGVIANEYFLGKHNSYGFFDGKIQEAVIYPADKSSLRSNIELEVNTYYSIY